MDVKKAIQLRRSYRSLSPIEITPAIIDSLSTAAQLMCSCFNNQPWRFVFVYKDPELSSVKELGLNPGNRWAKAASMIIAVFSKIDMDCEIGTRIYNLFDTGMATAAMLLQATELGLVMHPIAGYVPEKVGEILGIPSQYQIITLLIVGKKIDVIPDFFKDFQRKAEVQRPKRLSLSEIIFHNRYSS